MEIKPKHDDASTAPHSAEPLECERLGVEFHDHEIRIQCINTLDYIFSYLILLMAIFWIWYSQCSSQELDSMRHIIMMGLTGLSILLRLGTKGYYSFDLVKREVNFIRVGLINLKSKVIDFHQLHAFTLQNEVTQTKNSIISSHYYVMITKDKNIIRISNDCSFVSEEAYNRMSMELARHVEIEYIPMRTDHVVLTLRMNNLAHVHFKDDYAVSSSFKMFLCLISLIPALFALLYLIGEYP